MSNYKFIGIEDCGSATCPHCGSDGRYIYTWEVDGIKKSAMAGCYNKLTCAIKKNDEDKYFELLAEKQTKGKTLNGWDKSILRMLDFRKNGTYPDLWIDKKIKEILSERKKYLDLKHY